MSTPMLCRDAGPADLPALSGLEAQFPGDRLSRRQLRHHLSSPRAALRVLEGPSGLLGYSLLLNRRGSALWRLYSLVVDASARGAGLGRILLLDAERHAAAAGAAALRLEVRADNQAAIALYLRAGYGERASKPGYYDDGVDARVLQRSLASDHP